MKKYLIALFLVLIFVIVAVVYYKSAVVSKVDSFQACAEMGYPILESYPRQCRTPDGRSFTEEISEDKSDLIRLTSVTAGDEIVSPLVLEGEARGVWFFEASFPVKLLDSEGNVIPLDPPYVMATEDWMTTEFIPFKAVLTFVSPGSGAGTLILQKDNPSGLPEHDDSLIIPIVFGKSSTTSSACRPTGCSSQICSDKDVVTTCEFKEEYACYKEAVCERQDNGQCGWTLTSGYTQCVNKIN